MEVTSIQRARWLQPCDREGAGAGYSRGMALLLLGFHLLCLVACSAKDHAESGDFQTGFQYEQAGDTGMAIQQYNEIIATTPNHLTARKRLGGLLIETGQLQEAEKHLTIASELDPTDAEILNDLAHIAFDRKDYVKSILLYRRAISLAPGEAKYYYNLGAVYQNVDRCSQALQNFNRAIDLDPTLADAYLASGLCHSKMKNQRDAVAIWQQADRLGLQSAEIAFYLGLASLDADQLSAAKAYFDKALRYAPQLPEPHNGLAALALRQGNLKRAMFHWKAAADRLSASRFVQGNLGFNRAYEARRFAVENSLDIIVGVASVEYRPEVVDGLRLLKSGDFRAAEQSLRKAASLDPKNQEVKNFLAYALALQGEYSAAHDLWEGLANSASGDVQVLNNLGVMKSSLGYPAAAIDLFKKVIDMEPLFWRGYHNLAAVYARKGEVAQAVATYKKALAIDERVPEVHNDLGFVYEKSNAIEEALESYARAIEIDPDFEMANFNLGLLHLRNNAYEKAEQHFRKVLQSSPNDVEAMVNLGYIFGKSGKLKEAQQLWEKASRLDSKSAIARNNIGVVLYLQGDYAGATEAFYAAGTIDPKLASSYNNKAAALVKSGRIDAAIDAYKKAVAANPKDIESRRNLGKLQLDKGQLDEARDQFQILVSGENVDATALFLLGVTYQKQKRIGAAITCYEAFLDLVGADPRFSEYSFHAQRAIEQLSLTAQIN